MCHNIRSVSRAIVAVVTLVFAVAAAPLAKAEGPGDKGAEIGAPPTYGGPFAGEPFASEPFTGQPLDLGEAAPAQIGATFALAAPGFVGDFFGGATGTASRVAIDRIIVGSRIINGPFPSSGATNRFTVSDPNAGRGIFSSGGFTLVEPGEGRFTTTISEGEFANRINSSQTSSASAPIENHPLYESLATGQLVGRNGPGGSTAFDAGASQVTFSRDPATESSLYEAQYAYDYIVELNVPSPSAGGVVGRQKLVENSSPIPRDRILFNYSLFQNVQFVPGGIDVNRFVAGFEKTFWDQQISLELRAPFASTLDSNLVVGSQTGGTNTEFGNLTLYGKALLLTGQSFALGAGLGLAFPTADDVTVGTAGGTSLAEIRNDAVHLLPYVGGVYAPNDRFFAQAILQFDIDANGNPAFITDFQNGLQPVGRLNDTTWCFASFNMGYWMYRAPVSQRLSGVAPLFEVHYNKTTQTSDFVQSGGIRLGEPFENIEMINLVGGATFELFGTSYLSLAYIAPVTGGNDRFFDGEYRVLFNRYF